MLTLVKYCMYPCLLFALSFVDTLLIRSHVGKDVEFKCSGWKTVFSLRNNVKYLCESPCKRDKHTIITAKLGKTEHKGRIQLTNTGEDLHVKFTNLQKSDSKIYYCGADRLFSDSLIEVNLQVTEVEPSRDETTPTSRIDSTLSFAIASSSCITTDLTTPHFTHFEKTNTTSQGAGLELHFLLVSVVVLMVILIVLLIIKKKMTKKQLKEEDALQGEVSLEDQQSMSQPLDVSNDYASADASNIYENHPSHQHTQFNAQRDVTYSAVLDLNSTSDYGASSEGAHDAIRAKHHQSDCVYSFVQRPKD